jgi:hypothetical protein
MTVNELRIGNWVKWNGDDHQEIALVASIYKEEVGFMTQTAVERLVDFASCIILVHVF